MNLLRLSIFLFFSLLLVSCVAHLKVVDKKEAHSRMPAQKAYPSAADECRLNILRTVWTFAISEKQATVYSFDKDYPTGEVRKLDEVRAEVKIRPYTSMNTYGITITPNCSVSSIELLHFVELPPDNGSQKAY